MYEEEEMTAEDQFEEICEDDMEPSDGDFSDSDFYEDWLVKKRKQGADPLVWDLCLLFLA